MKFLTILTACVVLLSASAHAEKRTIQAKKTAAQPKASAAPAKAAAPKRKADDAPGTSVFNPPPIGNAAPVAAGTLGSKGKTAGEGESEGSAAQHGALIRSEGLVTPSWTVATGRHEVDGGGNYITDDPGKSLILNPHPGVRMGKADTPPSTGASGKNGVVANAPAGE